MLEVFTEEGFPYPEKPVFLSEEEYSRALSTFVIGAVDILPICYGKLFFAKRRAEPMADWWILGGRMQFGETPEEAAARCFKRETGLEIKPAEFKKFTAYMPMWKTRAEKPQNAGKHYISIVHALEVRPEQVKNFKLDSVEYTGETMLLSPEEVEKMIKSDKLHRYFKAVLRDLKVSGLMP